MFGVECTGPGRSKAGANCLHAFYGAAELQTFDPNRCVSAVSCRENSPHIRAQGVDRTLKILQPSRGYGGARKAGVHVVEQTAEREQLLGERLIRHIRECPSEKGLPNRPRISCGDFLTAHFLRFLRPEARQLHALVRVPPLALGRSRAVWHHGTVRGTTEPFKYRITARPLFGPWWYDAGVGF
jgi:hypothetical protein